MAVQAHHSPNNLFHSSHGQFVLANRELLRVNQETTTAMNHETFPICQNRQSDSDLTYYNAAPRKRLRDHQSFYQDTTASDGAELSAGHNAHKLARISPDSLIDNDIAFQIQQHQCEIDRFVAHHAERVRLELEKQRKREARMVLMAFEEGIARRLKEKDDEILRMGKLNWVLQERIKTLCVENQLWKELAQSNEATALSLRTNLEQALLAHVSPPAPAPAEEAESCCGETDGEEGGGGGVNARRCKGCGEEEARVLVLPCRHLCLCAQCGSHLRYCPVCTSLMTASVRVNFS